MMVCFFIFLVVVRLLTAGQTIKMIYTEPDSSLSDKAGYAELAGSSLKDLAEFSVCGRIFTSSFLTAPDSSPVQAIFSVPGLHLLASYAALPCTSKGGGLLEIYISYSDQKASIKQSHNGLK